MAIKLSLVACLAFILLASSVQSTEQGSKSAQPSSRQAYIDEATGELTSTPPADVGLNKTTEALEQTEEQAIEYITHPDGTVEGKLDGQYQSELKVVLACDGSLTKTHSSDGGETSNSESIARCEEPE